MTAGQLFLQQRNIFNLLMEYVEKYNNFII